MQAYNTKLRLRVTNLQMALKVKDEEICQVWARIESLEKIWEVLGTPKDVLNKARLFDNDVKSEGEVSAAKVIPVLVSFTMKMEATLAEIWKLLSRSPVGSSQAPSLWEHKKLVFG